MHSTAVTAYRSHYGLRPTDPADQTSLEPHETSVDPAPDSLSADCPAKLDSPMAWRHTGWAGTRQRVLNALAATAQSQARIDRMHSCGSDVWVVEQVAPPHRIRLSGNYCRDRMCKPCQAARGRRIAGRLAKLCDGHTLRMITLTLRHQARSLTDTLNHLYASYRRLRQTRTWTDSVTAAAAVLEVTRNLNSKTWHAHLHVLTTGTYLAQRLLVRAWLHATGDSYIVDIRRVHDHRQAIAYLTRYISKPTNTRTYCDPDALAEYVVAISGRRMVLVTGAWHGTGLTDDPPQEEWTNVVPLSQLLAWVRHGDPAATELLRRLIERPDLPWEEHPP